MNVLDIMAFKPGNAPKRTIENPIDASEITDDPNDNYEARAKKRKLAVARAKAIAAKAEEDAKMRQLEQDALEKKQNVTAYDDHVHKISQLVDQGESFDQVSLDSAGIKRLLLMFEKKVTKNQEQRIKHSEEPEKFLESELELHDSIRDLHILATVPDLYQVVVDVGCVPSLLGLLSHANTDIAVAAVDLLEEITDVDILIENSDGALALLESILVSRVLPLLADNLERLDETVKEESEGIHNTLAIIEHILELMPETSHQVASAGFLAWIIKKLKVKVVYDANKLYASEILSILLHDNVKNRLMFGEMGAIDSILQQLAYFKRHDPSTLEEVELMENLFDCVCCLLLEAGNRDKFLSGEGLQLMNLMLREKKKSRGGALKVLSHALSGDGGKELCLKFVEILGLRTLFPLFMKTPSRGKRSGISAKDHEEHVVNILASLVRNLSAENVDAGMKGRLLTKFVENDYEKVDRLVELHCNYLASAMETEKILRNEATGWKGSKEQVEEEMYLKSLEEGLFTLQQLDYIMSVICEHGASSIKPRMEKGLSLRGKKLSDAKDIINRVQLADDGQ